jgi:hypothetical protein
MMIILVMSIISTWNGTLGIGNLSHHRRAVRVKPRNLQPHVCQSRCLVVDVADIRMVDGAVAVDMCPHR